MRCGGIPKLDLVNEDEQEYKGVVSLAELGRIQRLIQRTFPSSLAELF